jgi:hypothetical protein
VGTLLTAALFAIPAYPGRTGIYLVFSLLVNGLLFSGFRQGALFFDAFIGVLIWLGFWAKLTARLILFDGQLYDQTGNFDGSGAGFDKALLAASCAALGLLAASFLRERLIFRYISQSATGEGGLYAFYLRYRIIVLIGFVLFALAIAVANWGLGIYQRGEISRTVLPFGLKGVFTWLLLFGLASVSALILNFELVLKRANSTLVVVIALLETLVSNVSMLSRGMVINGSALLYGVFRAVRINRLGLRLRRFSVWIGLFVVLFVLSAFVVNQLRGSFFSEAPSYREIGRVVHSTKLLFLDRWVGIESLLAVSSSPEQGWDLWSEAWDEIQVSDKLSFFDSRLIDSPYRETDLTKHYFISLPGIVAFSFYPGSFVFVFLFLFGAGLIGATAEILAYHAGHRNLILAALIAQVVAFRYSHFGYVPAQSYLLFGAILLNLILIFGVDKLLSGFGRR